MSQRELNDCFEQIFNFSGRLSSTKATAFDLPLDALNALIDSLCEFEQDEHFLLAITTVRDSFVKGIQELRADYRKSVHREIILRCFLLSLFVKSKSPQFFYRAEVGTAMDVTRLNGRPLTSAERLLTLRTYYLFCSAWIRLDEIAGQLSARQDFSALETSVELKLLRSPLVTLNVVALIERIL